MNYESLFPNSKYESYQLIAYAFITEGLEAGIANPR